LQQAYGRPVEQSLRFAQIVNFADFHDAPLVCGPACPNAK
jgi:hypothetical protein